LRGVLAATLATLATLAAQRGRVFLAAVVGDPLPSRSQRWRGARRAPSLEVEHLDAFQPRFEAWVVVLRRE
jgi:hypothetical protein